MGWLCQAIRFPHSHWWGSARSEEAQLTNSFVSIDFETANSFQGSACEVGLYRVVDGVPSGELHSLLRPHPEHAQFDGINIGVHGIRSSDVADSPDFLQLWPSVSEFVGDLPLVAHNAAFDIRVLRELFRLYAIPVPAISYFCTLVLSRRVLDLVSYSLPFVAQDLGIEHTVLHRAGSDAQCAGEVALALLSRSGQPNLGCLAESLGIAAGSFDADSLFSSRSQAHKSSHLSKLTIDTIRDAIGDVSAANPDGQLFGHRVAFTGGLSSMTREEAAGRVLAAGGEPQAGVTKHTDFLVVGAENGYTIDPRTAFTAKFAKAEALRAKGSKIEILDELSFTRMF
jgi:DNA polymerase-3 subunit epsilon